MPDPAPFSTLALRPELVAGIERLGYAAMTDIQASALPIALEGRDVVGHARTGSGKTTVFGLALLQRIETALRLPQALVLCPTRELAEQLVASLRALASAFDGVRIIAVTGGSPSRAQRDALEAGTHVIVGTPGRVLQHLELGRIDPANLKTLVLDEADRMLDMGFEPQVSAIVALLPAERQTLLFSATWPDAMQHLSRRVQRRAAMVSAETRVERHLLRQRAVLCTHEQREDAILGILADREPTPTLVFCETRAQTRDVTRVLRGEGVAALALHGELEQRERDERMVCFRNGTATVLVATNLAARGLDVADIRLVISYEVSPDPSVHLHRVGRTARAEAEGEAITLVAGDGVELRRLDAIEAFLGEAIPRDRWAARDIPALDDWASDWRTVAIHGGRGDKLSAGDVLGALTRGLGLDASDVGRIVLTDRRCWVAVRASVADRACHALGTEPIKKRRFRAHLVDGRQP